MSNPGPRKDDSAPSGTSSLHEYLAEPENQRLTGPGTTTNDTEMAGVSQQTEATHASHTGRQAPLEDTEMAEEIEEAASNEPAFPSQAASLGSASFLDYSASPRTFESNEDSNSLRNASAYAQNTARGL
jgi:hypothetical protein